MLSSQITSVQMTSTSLNNTWRVSTTLLRQVGSLPRRCRPQQQTRDFRLGLWSSYLDQNFQKEIRRRHRVVKHKYIEALNRRLSWDRHLPGHPKHLGLKGFMCSAWRGQDPRPGGRWVDVDELLDHKGRPERSTGKGIEDVEQSAVDKLFRNQDAVYDYIRARSSRIWAWTDPASHESTTKIGTSYTSPSSVYDLEGFRKRFQSNQDSNTSSGELEYEIDPITNRKVFKNQSKAPIDSGRKPIEIPVKTFKGYRSQFQDKLPPSSSQSAPEPLPEDVTENDLRPGGTSSNLYDPAHGFEEYDCKVDYKSGQFYDPASIGTNHLDPVQKGLQDYDTKISSKGSTPAKFVSSKVEESKKDYQVHDCLKEYDDKVDYASGRFYKCAQKDIDYSHPDQCGLKEYDDKIFSGEGVPSKSDAKATNSVEKDGWEQYDSQVDYKSGQFYEPAGATIDYADPIQGGLKDYDGKISRRGLRDEPSIKTSELLDPVETAFKEHYENTTSRQATKKQEETTPQLDPVEEAFHGYDPVHEELKKYDAQINNERNGNSSSDPVADGLKDYDSRASYGPKGALDIPMKRGGFIRTVSGALGRLYQDVKDDLDLLRASDVRAGSGIIKNPKKETDSEKMAKRKQLESDFNNLQGSELSSADELAAAEKVRQSRKLVEELRIEHSELQNHAAHARGRIDAKLAEVESGWPDSRKLTGNFARDFPEEFETSWTFKQGSSGSLSPKENTNPSNLPIEGSGMTSTEAFSSNSNATRIEPSLDRTTGRQVERDANNIENNGANIDQIQQHKERMRKKESDRKLIQEVRKIYEEKYGTIDTKHRQIDSTAKSSSVTETGRGSSACAPVLENAEPTLYKILAYDPTMQSISTAETTSIVHDSSGALTPAEVLLRLSNPAKFFPHFQPLQSEGYEIVSGSGDVLVFRKVRSGAPAGVCVESKPVFPEKNLNYKATNPIDGMQSSPVAATGNFASPTGFVNHDFPGVSDPPFKSNIDVRREEPVFSGKRNWEDDSEGSRRKGRGKFKKVLIGGAWVAAASYAVGVVTEFFKTGGTDGKGPEGF